MFSFVSSFTLIALLRFVNRLVLDVRQDHPPPHLVAGIFEVADDGCLPKQKGPEIPDMRLCRPKDAREDGDGVFIDPFKGFFLFAEGVKKG